MDGFDASELSLQGADGWISVDITGMIRTTGALES